MKFKPIRPVFRFDSETEAELRSICHRNDPERVLRGDLVFTTEVPSSVVAVGDSSLDFLSDLDKGAVDSSKIQQNNEYQFKGDSESACEHMNEIFGFQVVNRLEAMDKNYNPAGWQSVQERLGLDVHFDKVNTVDDMPE